LLVCGEIKEVFKEHVESELGVYRGWALERERKMLTM
jgi:hypothetical protein